jgi:hypothetical protein
LPEARTWWREEIEERGRAMTANDLP